MTIFVTVTRPDYQHHIWKAITKMNKEKTVGAVILVVVSIAATLVVTGSKPVSVITIGIMISFALFLIRED